MLEALQVAKPLSAYIDALEAQGIVSAVSALDPSAMIERVTDDSRAAGPNTLFVCKGASFKREYLLDAIGAGAIAYVSETDYRVAEEAPEVACILVNDIRRALGTLADFSYGHPSDNVKVLGFTGTKGKTTCVYYLRAIMAEQARRDGTPRPAFLTGVEYDDGRCAGPSHLTTPEPFELQQHIARAASVGAPCLVMEVSSQALKYHRTLGVEFEVGAFTNIGEDHISPIEHPTFEDYFASKLKLFGQCKTVVVNLDMDHVDRVLEAAASCERVLTYSVKDPAADVYASEFQTVDAGLSMLLRTPSYERRITLASPVMFNASNALAAVAVAEAVGAGADAVEQALANVKVPGRMELYPTPSGGILGVVDYAHNGMSLETLLSSLRAGYPDRELTVMFGSTGGKGIDRRFGMGEAAGKLADRIVITEDDPGPEDPAAICEDIASSVRAQGNGSYHIVLDRAQAIREAVAGCTPPALVVLAGKGCETEMKRAHGADPWTPDGEQLERALADYEAGTL